MCSSCENYFYLLSWNSLWSCPSGWGGGGTRPIFGYRWAAEGFKPWPWLGQRTKCTPSCSKAIYWQSQIHVIVIAFVWTTKKIHLANQINRAGNTLLADSPGNYVPCLGQRGKNHTLSSGTSPYRSCMSKGVPPPPPIRASPLLK